MSVLLKSVVTCDGCHKTIERNPDTETLLPEGWAQVDLSSGNGYTRKIVKVRHVCDVCFDSTSLGQVFKGE
jgi:hypothetical protein